MSEAFRDTLLEWYESNSRPLPWRRTRDPYRILVSEVMLQQTQAARVAPVYEAFCARFPTVQDLAGASVAEVVRAWKGMGYNRRAVHLHQAAQAVVERHGGQVPPELEALRMLPGVGEYTARAVLAFAFGHDVAPVDTNVARVLLRALAARKLSRRRLQVLADGLVPAGRAAAWASAVMDLAASACKARAPRCAACPVVDVCAWRRNGGPDPAASPARSGPFVGSDRFHRGRLVDALRLGAVPREQMCAAARLADAERVARLVDALVAEGLAEWGSAGLSLPQERQHADG